MRHTTCAHVYATVKSYVCVTSGVGCKLGPHTQIRQSESSNVCAMIFARLSPAKTESVETGLLCVVDVLRAYCHSAHPIKNVQFEWHKQKRVTYLHFVNGGTIEIGRHLIAIRTQTHTDSAYPFFAANSICSLRLSFKLHKLLVHIFCTHRITTQNPCNCVITPLPFEQKTPHGCHRYTHITNQPARLV